MLPRAATAKEAAWKVLPGAEDHREVHCASDVTGKHVSSVIRFSLLNGIDIPEPMGHTRHNLPVSSCGPGRRLKDIFYSNLNRGKTSFAAKIIYIHPLPSRLHSCCASGIGLLPVCKPSGTCAGCRIRKSVVRFFALSVCCCVCCASVFVWPRQQSSFGFLLAVLCLLSWWEGLVAGGVVIVLAAAFASALCRCNAFGVVLAIAEFIVRTFPAIRSSVKTWVAFISSHLERNLPPEAGTHLLHFCQLQPFDVHIERYSGGGGGRGDGVVCVGRKSDESRWI